MFASRTSQHVDAPSVLWLRAVRPKMKQQPPTVCDLESSKSLSTLAMSTTTNTQLCAFCQRKPRHASFEYCGKTCAKQASNLCNNCHQKPKFAGHDFCSKKCGSASQVASSANANASVPNTSKPNASTGQAAHKGIPSSNGGVVPPTVPQCQQAQGIDLTELAKNILQQLQPSSGAPLPQQISQIVAGLFSAQQPINNVPHSNNPYGYSVPSSHVPVQVDAQGFPIDPNFMPMPMQPMMPAYSQVPLCIMCRAKPQTSYNHFCGDDCMDDALVKDY